MKRWPPFPWLVALAALGAPLFLGLSGASCSQPAIQCVVAHSPFYAKYTLVEGTGSCAQIKGDAIGMSTFLRPNADRTGANYDSRRIAIQSDTLGKLLQERDGLGAGDEDLPYAVGDYTSEPDANQICFAGTADKPLAAADMDVPEVPDKSLPAKHLRQEWKNVRLYVTADAPGTQAIGEMVYEDVLEGCKATYTFVALAPAVYCEGTGTDGKPNGKPDDSLCDPKADPAHGRTFGSGINPDFKTRCDPELLYCVLAETPLPARGL
jgi:hypothetical protein